MATMIRLKLNSDPCDNPKSLDTLLAIPECDLHRCDIARMNLLCATGLPGTDELNVDRCLHTIDKWSKRAEFETGRHAYRVKDPRFAVRYGGSHAKFRAEMLAQVLQEDCGVRYNPRRILNPDFRNPKDLFIHGMIEDSNGGTCVSMPVLYAAVGRRLGYPIKLVHAKAHLFCRWEGTHNRFNIESASSGFSFLPDEYYRAWPHPISEEEVRTGEFLASLSPAQELAASLAARAWCLEDNDRIEEAINAYEAACHLHLQFRTYSVFLKRLRMRENSVGTHASSPEGAAFEVRSALEANNTII